jgi:hypothetical protein
VPVQEASSPHPSSKQTTGLANNGIVEMKKKPNLFDNIRKKRARIKAGSGERMARPGEKGRPSNKTFRIAAAGAKKPRKK